MKRFQDQTFVYLLLLSAVVIPSAWGTALNINNPGFENAVNTFNTGNGPFGQVVPGSSIAPQGGILTNWVVNFSSTDSAAGSFAPFNGGNNWTTTWWGGKNVGYLQVASPGVSVSLSQLLTDTLQNDTT